ncbi:MAG TPA: hypothetical protein VNI34_07865 [Candidatus Nitrosotalea sp.]|nr:hypothetical protein [Candidatus Nitrosotalea sp.]
MAMDPFALAEGRYRFLLEERNQGRLDAREFRAEVRRLRVEDGEQRDWIIGPGNGVWYRRERDRWMEMEPPRRLVCTQCGHHNLTRHSFCVECGHRLDRTHV